MSLSKARQERYRLRKLVRAGTDPLAEREATLAARRSDEQAEALRERRQAAIFKTIAEDFIAIKEAGWRNPKHRQQWQNTLRDYAHPVIGDLPVSEVTTEHILTIIQPIWMDKTETASRLQGRIERILDYAKTMQLREGENPARWRGHLDNILPARGRVQKVEHLRALPWADAPALAATLRETDAPGARALLLTLLCAIRSGETLGATWNEIDFEKSLWTIPGERMKAGKPHRIPLSRAAIAVLRRQEYKRRNQWVFPAQRKLSDESLSYMAMSKVLERANWLSRTTVHGLRSTFRDWISEETDYPDRLAEVALAHQLADRVQAAYNRSDQLQKRREIMESWAHHLLGDIAGHNQL